MPSPLDHARLPLFARRQRTCLEHAGITPESHRPSLVRDIALLRQEIDHRMRSKGVELCRIRVVGPEGRARELDDHALHAHAETERRHLALAAEAHGLHLALDAAVTESARHDDPLEADERLDATVALELLP